MTEAAPFVLNSVAYLCADGPELLAYSAVDGEPLWKVFAGNIIVSMGANDKLVFVLDVDGRLQTYRLIDGLPMDPGELGPGAHGLTVDKTGAWGAIREDQVVLYGPWGLREVPLAEPSVVGFGEGATRAGMGSRTGQFYAVDPMSGVAWGTVDLGVPIVGVAWNAKGFWVVAGGTRLFEVAADGTEILQTIELGREPTRIAISPEGQIVAWLAGMREIHLVDLGTQQRIGGISYRHRTVGGMCFADSAILGVGLDDGDANRFELLTGDVGRTGQHRGKAFSQWAADLELDPKKVRGAMARNQALGGLVAERVHRDEKGQVAPSAEEQAEQDSPAGRAKSRITGCLVSSGVGCLSLIACMGCSGIFYQIYHRIYYGY